MEVIREGSEVKVKEEASDTNIQGQIQIDLITDWKKLNRNVEWRDTRSLPSMESQVSTVSGTQMGKGQNGTNVRREDEGFIGDALQIQIPTIADGIDIKYEEYGIEINSTSIADGDCDIDPGPHSILSNMNPKRASQSPINSEQIELSEFYHHLLQCERDCETCQKYIRKLSEHIRTTHSPAQPTCDPLYIDLHNTDQSSAIEIKSEVGEDIEIEREESFPESESDTDFWIQSENERDPDYTISTDSTKNDRGKGNSEKDPLSDDNRNITGKKESKTRFNCTDCGKSFRTRSRLTDHIRTHTGERPFRCTECEKSYPQKRNLDRHMKSHTERPSPCGLCLKVFSTKINMVNHMRSHTEDKPFKCTLCEKSFIIKAKLEVHMRSHTGEKPFKCRECNKNFSQKCNLDLHMRCHTGEKPFKCSQCEKSFTCKGNLDVHIRRHTGEKPFMCGECNKNFKTNYELIIHVRSHTGEKPYKCSACAKSFSKKSHLNRHVRSHSGDKPFKCDLCLKSFSTKSHLRVHMTSHTQRRSFKCGECNKSFIQKRSLDSHMKNHVFGESALSQSSSRVI